MIFLILKHYFYITPMPQKHLAFAILFFAFTAHSGDNTLTYGGKTYKTVKIGTQTWMAENLNYDVKGSKCYGESGHVITDFDEDDNPVIKTISKKEAQDNCAKYGRLYDWKTANKVCPKGWHLPSNEDWDKLYRFVDGDTSSVHNDSRPYESPMAGKHLKAKSGWNSHEKSDGNGTDTHGFSALPGGVGDSDGNFSYAGDIGYWWSESEGYPNFAFSRYLNYDEGAYWHYGLTYLFKLRIYFLFSVRCLQD